MLYAVKTPKCDNICIVSFNVAYKFVQRSPKTLKIVLQYLSGDFDVQYKICIWGVLLIIQYIYQIMYLTCNNGI